jgi:hypothetical protein
MHKSFKEWNKRKMKQWEEQPELIMEDWEEERNKVITDLITVDNILYINTQVSNDAARDEIKTLINKLEGKK